MRNDIICGKCKRKGHEVEDCFNRKAAEKVSFIDDEKFEDGKHEFSFFTNPVFVIDSRCS